MPVVIADPKVKKDESRTTDYRKTFQTDVVLSLIQLKRLRRSNMSDYAKDHSPKRGNKIGVAPASSGTEEAPTHKQSERDVKLGEGLDFNAVCRLPTVKLKLRMLSTTIRLLGRML